MASSMTDWGVGEFLNICLGLDTAPANMYVALASDDPGTQIDGDELNDLEPDPLLGYSRVALPMGPSNWTDPSGTQYSTNINAVEFGIPGGAWGVMSHFALCSALTSGEVYLYGEFDVPADLNGTYDFSIPAGGIVIAFGSFQPSIVSL